jgi:hypothetical protein
MTSRSRAVSDGRHDIAVPVLAWGDGGARGLPPRPKLSTMIMRPPQQGHGGRSSATAAATIGIKHRVEPNIDFAPHLNGIGGAVAVAAISGIEAQKIDSLLPFQIDEPEDFAAPHNVPPRPSRRHDLVENDNSAHAASVARVSIPRSTAIKAWYHDDTGLGSGEHMTSEV